MASKGYTNPDKVQLFLGAALTPNQISQAEMRLLPAAEAAIDNYCRRAWMLGAQTDEAHYGPFVGNDLWVKYPPVTTLTAVKSRSGLTATETTLTAGTDYEARDLAFGRIYLVSPSSYDRVRVTYTPDATLPDDVGLAATMLVAHWLRPALMPDSYGIERFQLPDLAVTFARGYAGLELPPSVEALLGPHVFPALG